MSNASKLIAHRGDMYNYPENTLPALQGAIDAGAACLEFDIQFSGDRVPILFHDCSLKRTTDKRGTVIDYSANELGQIYANQPAHLAKAYIPATIPTLTETVELLNVTPKVKAFVELKRHSVNHFGIEACIDRLIDTLATANFPWTLISFREDTLHYAKRRYGVSIGWILHQYSDRSHRIAKNLSPEFIFCKLQRLPINGKRLWSGPWRWVTYDITDARHALELLHRGIDMVETSRVTEMLGKSGFPLKPGQFVNSKG